MVNSFFYLSPLRIIGLHDECGGRRLAFLSSFSFLRGTTRIRQCATPLIKIKRMIQNPQTLIRRGHRWIGWKMKRDLFVSMVTKPSLEQELTWSLQASLALFKALVTCTIACPPSRFQRDFHSSLVFIQKSPAPGFKWFTWNPSVHLFL